MRKELAIDQGAFTSTAMSAIQAQTTTYRWATQHVPALREETYMTTPGDYVARIDFELAGTRMPGACYRNMAGNWSKISAELLASEDFGLLLDRAGFLYVRQLKTRRPAGSRTLPAAKYTEYRDFRRKINQADHTQVVLVSAGA